MARVPSCLSVAAAAFVMVACGSTEPACTPIEATAPQIQEKVFKASCAFSACHGTAKKGGLDLSTVEASCKALRGPSCLFPDRPRILPEDPSQSVLVAKLTCSGADCTPALGAASSACATTNQRMPMGGPALSECAIAALEEWIANGQRGCDPQ